MKTRSKPFERYQMLKRNSKVSEQGPKRSKETREFRKRLEKLKAKSKLLERNYRVSEKEQNARKRLEHF